MLVTKMVPVEIEVTGIRVRVPVRYEEDQEELQGCPGFDGQSLDLTLSLDGTVKDWDGVPRSLHLKVVDSGVYDLLDGSGDSIATVADYVPRCLPQEYGDYIVMNVLASGDVERWTPKAVDIEDAFGLRGEE